MRSLWVVATKELTDLVRDRRALLVGLLLPAMAVPAISEILQAGLQRRLQAPARVAVVGGHHAPALLQAAQGFFDPVPVADPESALRQGQLDAVLIVPEDFNRAVEQARAELTLKYRAQDPDGLAAREKVLQAIAQYTLPLVERTLGQRGLTREALTPVQLREEPVAGGGGWLGFTVPLFVVVWAFAGAAVVAADVTAGERERGTWDLLLCSPVGRWGIVAGKFLACSVAGLAVAFATVGSQLALAGARSGFLLSPLQFAAVAVAALCSTWVAASGALALSLLARSAREANQYALPLYLAALAAAAAAEGLRAWPLSSLVPVLNAFLLAQAAMGGSVEVVPLVHAVASSLAAAGALMAIAHRLMGREQT